MSICNVFIADVPDDYDDSDTEGPIPVNQDQLSYGDGHESYDEGQRSYDESQRSDRTSVADTDSEVVMASPKSRPSSALSNMVCTCTNV